MSDDWNDHMYGKCYRSTHGHNFILDVCVDGKVNDETGMVMNFDELKVIVEQKVINKLDHKDLNDLFDFIPTSENLVEWIGDQLKNLNLCWIRLYETENSWVVKEYDGKTKNES